MARFGEWLNEPDQFDAVTAVLHHRGLIGSARVLMALVASTAAFAALSLLIPNYRNLSAGIILVSGIAAALASTMTCFWLTRWPTRRLSLFSTLIGTLCVAAFSVSQSTPALAALTCTAAAITGGYIAFFHNNRALLFNIAIGLTASAYAAYRIAHHADLTTALAAFWLLWLINLTVPLAIRGTSTAMSQYAARSDEDPLTGLLNRRGFSDTVERRLVAEMTSGHLVVIMIDLDDFKRINDTYGHAAGDRVLLRVADILRQHAPEDAAICRAGGEEFLMAAASQTPDGASFTTPLCEAISALAGNVTASVGVAVAGGEDVRAAPRPAEFVEQLICAADLAMYEAKRSGGNRVVVSTRA
ncbi:diguanylate cyclase domain-containing protein [Mycobacterium sp. BMJ-28]